MTSSRPLADAPILVTNLHRRYTGGSRVVHALVPVLQRERAVAVLDAGRLGLERTASFWDVLKDGWRPPPGYVHRVWHARRDLDMALGLVLKHLLRQPWRLLFTSDSPRHHGRVLQGMMNRMDAIIATSERVTTFIDWHTAIVPHGIDCDDFQPPVDKLAAWQESGLPGKYGIGTFGRIRHSKATDIFVTSMCELLPRYPDFTAVITGYCKDSDADFKAGLEQQIRDAGLEDRIVFLGDLSDDDIKLWYQRIVLCAAPSRSEGFGLTPLEAMASGAAAVTSKTGYFPQMMVPGVNGDIVDTEDQEAFTRAVEQLITDPGRLVAMGKTARDYALEHHSIQREAQGTYAVYDQLLGKA